MTATLGTTGVITQIIGPVMDISFPPGKMPNIYNAVNVEGTLDSGETIGITQYQHTVYVKQVLQRTFLKT